MRPDQEARQDQPDGDQRLAAISGLDDPVRRRLYDYVRGHGEPAGRDEAAAATGIGRPLAAYHLDKLVELGLLVADYRRPAGRGGPGAGRPAKVYARSGREFAVTVPQREYELAARLLAQAVESDTSGAADAALRRAARQFGAELARSSAARPPGSGPAAGAQAARQQLLAALTAHGFEPATDEDASRQDGTGADGGGADGGADGGGAEGTVRLRSCPFHQLALAHREVVCGMNLALIAGLADGLGAEWLHPRLDPAPGRCCVVIRVGSGGTIRTLPHELEHHDQRTDS